MVAKARREREKGEVQRRILDAAREIFARDGYEAVTMRAIADRIEYTPTALYFHFRDKRSLVRRLCAEDFAALAARFQVLARVPDPVERLRKLGRAYIGFAVEHPNHYRLMFLAPDPSTATGDGPARNGDAERDACAFLRPSIVEAAAAGLLRPEVSDADLASQVYWAGIHGIASLQIAKGDDAGIAWRPLDERIDAMVEVLLTGLLRGAPGEA